MLHRTAPTQIRSPALNSVSMTKSSTSGLFQLNHRFQQGLPTTVLAESSSQVLGTPVTASSRLASLLRPSPPPSPPSSPPLNRGQMDKLRLIFDIGLEVYELIERHSKNSGESIVLPTTASQASTQNASPDNDIKRRLTTELSMLQPYLPVNRSNPAEELHLLSQRASVADWRTAATGERPKALSENLQFALSSAAEPWQHRTSVAESEGNELRCSSEQSLQHGASTSAPRMPSDQQSAVDGPSHADLLPGNSDWLPIHVEDIPEKAIREAVPTGIDQLLFIEGEHMQASAFHRVFLA